MSIPLFRLSTATCLLVLAASSWAAPQQSAKKTGYDAYSLLRTRNIFDPERQPGMNNTSATPAPAPAQTSADYAALTGTMITAEKTLAFFSGSRPEYNAVLTTNGKIAGARINKITANSVEVERNGKHVTVAVGQTVPLDSSSAPTAAPASSPSTTTANNPSPSSSTSGPSVDREAVMRRMMEKRQQELK